MLHSPPLVDVYLLAKLLTIKRVSSDCNFNNQYILDVIAVPQKLFQRCPVGGAFTPESDHSASIVQHFNKAWKSFVPIDILKGRCSNLNSNSVLHDYESKQSVEILFKQCEHCPLSARCVAG